MACIIQMQRRAIERLRPRRPTWPRHCLEKAGRNLTSLSLKLESGLELFLYGISQGVGTCSDIHGMNVAVLGVNPPSVKLNPETRDELLRSEYFVLLTDPNRIACSSPPKQKLEVLFAEEVKFDQTRIKITFRKTGRSTTYVNLI